MRRVANIELHKSLLIVILHVAGLYGEEWHCLSSMFMWSVLGFVFITCYWGFTLSVNEALCSYGICLCCIPASKLMKKVVAGGGQF